MIHRSLIKFPQPPPEVDVAKRIILRNDPIIIHSGGFRSKRLGPSRVHFGHMENDFINNMISCVVEGDYFRIPRIIKR